MARLLVIDQEESLCQMLEIAFGKDGHTVESVTTGQAGKEKITARNYDIIISDVRMPDISGIELLEVARMAKWRVPFILMTAVPTVTTAIQAVNLRAYRYVVKTDRLVEDIRSAVEGTLRQEPQP